MPWFWFLLMLMALLIGNSTESASGLGQWLQGTLKSEANLLVLVGPTMIALLLAKAWMVYIGRYVESGDLSQLSATKMWELGLRWATILGAIVLVALEPLAGVTYQVQQAKAHSETWATLLTLIPILLFAVMMDSLAYQWEEYCSEISDSDSDTKLDKPWVYLWRKAQYGWLLPLIPMLVSCLGVDLLKLVVAEQFLEQWAVLFVPILSCIVAAMVGGVLLNLCTSSLCGSNPNRQPWLKMFQEVKSPVRDIRVWRTGNKINNAMLVGFGSIFRYVIVTDKLLNTLSPREMEMVLLHEAAHSRCRHGLKRFLGLGVALALLVAAYQFWSWCVGLGSVANSAMESNGLLWRFAFWGGLGGLMVVALVLLRMIKWIWHYTELEADRVACQLAAHLRKGEFSLPDSEEVTPWNERRQMWKSAMELSAALYNLVGNDERAGRDTWTHPSVKARVQKLADRFALGNS